jgi:hypothetical protein
MEDDPKPVIEFGWDSIAGPDGEQGKALRELKINGDTVPSSGTVLVHKGFRTMAGSDVPASSQSSVRVRRPRDQNWYHTLGDNDDVEAEREMIEKIVRAGLGG